ncbi:MAG: VCBS repeat-containing protein [Candidatus Eisenbacteria bacterium]|nr:VCBS repeat-containing protein [Candidatus Eisenbacteria bacterium]
MSAPSRAPSAPRWRTARGFTLVELLITLVVLGIAVVALFGFVTSTRRVFTEQSNLAEAQHEARSALDLVTRDIRCAGYGADQNASPPQPAFAYASATELIIVANLNPYPDTAAVRLGAPQAFDPAGAPQPATLAGSYLPTLKYRTGAELIRYTLDVNDDGLVNADDRADPLAQQALRGVTDPDAYLLVRQVYGDSSGSVPVAGNNGGSPEAVAVVHLPAGTPLITVFVGGSSTPYDWSGGPVAANDLDRISRVDVRISTAARKRDAQGELRTVTLGSSVGTLRNKPQGTKVMFVVDGYVYSDVNGDLSFEAPPDSGVRSAIVRLGSAQVTRTDARGYFMFVTTPGAYVLQAQAPPGFAPSAADTFTVNLVAHPSNTRHDFPDTALQGGTLADSAYLDANGNGVWEPGETGLAGVSITANGQTVLTDSRGAAAHFLPPGTFPVLARGPDTTVATTANPVSVTMTHGGYATAVWGFKPVTTGYFQGHVFRDANRNGSMNLGESGIANVWVAVLNGMDGSVVAWQNTDAQGGYVITVPSNASSHYPPYQVAFAPPPGFYPTAGTSRGMFYVAARDTAGPYDFGANSYTVITLNASRVLSLGTADLLEKDWSGNDNQWATKSHRDLDLVLGSERISSSNLSVWFNQYPATPLYTASADYVRDAMASVLAIATGSLDGATPTERQDVVTGLAYSSAGNFAVWFNQNSSGNLGYLPSAPVYYTSADHGDVSAVAIADLGGSADPDILVGTTSPIDHGTIELWLSEGGATPEFERDESFPPSGNIPGGVIGSVKSMALADLNGDGVADLVVGTRTGPYTGQILAFQGTGRTHGSRLHLAWSTTLAGQVTAVQVGDMNLDGHPDIVAGTITGAASGNIEYYRGDGSMNFSHIETVPTPGQVQSLVVANLGGDPNPDVAIGYEGTSGGYSGGTRIYDTVTGGWILGGGTDPSAGAQPYWTPALVVGDFNFGVQPSMPPAPYLPDLATAVKSGAGTGAVVIYVR